ncbi:type IV secretory system conjugative DNA transfer family protein [Pseudonocardia sp. ICBG1293]|uniref:type IV secretory system conjugative DNA transfer family protein n=1 Tax=Pseudonocardia sp. ICBG1293 TaxID=2844382 RepID=UPI001CCD7DC9|nr:type IV secretory system conjugative DNA transfer family protein [Pseudonocardia sp. ICBG1293]
MLTDAEIRSRHQVLGGGGLAVAVGSAGLAAAPVWESLAGLVDDAALVGGAVGSLAAAGALVHHRWHFHPARVFRRELGGQDGWLSNRDVAEQAGERGVRLTAAGIFRDRDPFTAPLHFSGWEAGRLVSGPAHLRLRRTRVYAPWTRGVGILGPQGSGKSQYLTRLVLDAPGAAVVTSTKTELARATMALRRTTRGPVAVFNPEALAGVSSTFRWDPVAGCEDSAVASARAAALVRGSGGVNGVEDASYWSGQAELILRGCLMAAAIAGRRMDTVVSWVNTRYEPRGTVPVPVEILTRAVQAGTAAVDATLPGMLRTALTQNEKTAATVMTNVHAALAFMQSPTIAAACTATDGDTLDLGEFLAAHGSLYLVGGANDNRVAPLFTALVEAVFAEAQRAAAEAGGVLPTTCTFLLDEVANLTPVPLDRWAADSRGWGITVVGVFQSLAQLSTRWGRDAGDVIWQNLPVKVILPGVSSTDDLDGLAYLAGKRRVRHDTEGESQGDGRRSRSVSVSRPRELVVEGDVISRMPRHHAYVLGLAPRPAVVRYTPGHELVATRRAMLGLAHDAT